ncbi:MAG: DUF1292 domain-containing protein [Culicoidibacterales bacterium]
MDERILIVTDENGQEIECEILMTFEAKEYGSHYVVYYPIDADEDEEEILMVATYNPEDGMDGALDPIDPTTVHPAELAMIEDRINDYLDSLDEEE